MTSSSSPDPSLVELSSTPKILDGQGRLRGNLRQLYRDLDSILLAFRGKSPPPYSLKDGSAYDNRAPQNATNALQQRDMEVVRIQPTAQDAVQITLRPTDGEIINFTPGQFLTVAIELNGQLIKRPYSICSSSSQNDSASIGVRMVPNGLMSTYLNQSLKVGDTVGTYGPSGSYGLPAGAPLPEHVVCVAGGSGITPHISILKHVLEQNDESRATLIFINRTKKSMMFQNELDALASQFGSRFTSRLFFSRSENTDDHINPKELKNVLTPFTQHNGQTDYFLCGPLSLMQEATQILSAAGVDEASINQEVFTATAASIAQEASPRSESLTVHTDAGHQITTVRPGQTILEAGLEAGSPLPFSCTMGGCGACKVKLISGEVSMPEPNCLSSEERQSGHILSCISRACGPVTLEVKK